MSERQNIIDDWIDAHPCQAAQLFLITVSSIWFFPVAVLGMILYIVLRRICKVHWLAVIGAGVLIAVVIVMIDIWQALADFNLVQYLHDGFKVNGLLCKLIMTGKQSSAIHVFYQQGTGYFLGMSVLLAGILSVMELIGNHAHQEAMEAIRKGEHLNVSNEMSDHKIESAIKKINEAKYDGAVLGVSKYTALPVILPDDFINQILLVLGTTGSGKTITLRRFYKRAITKAYPLIIVDGKPTTDNVQWVQTLAEKSGRKFYGFNCGNYSHYDPLSDGGYTELKDKVICLKDEWENDYYKSIAEDYLQAVFQVLSKSGQPFDLSQVAHCLDHGVLTDRVRDSGDDVLIKRVAMLGGYEKKDILGLRAHINLLIYSELGDYFAVNEKIFSLNYAIQENAIVYFALPALRFPGFSSVLGKLVINDLKAVIDRDTHHKRVFMIFDEFSVFAGEQVLNLVNMGRGKGVHAVFGTQGLADLSKISMDFKNQILNCANSIICHRLNDQESAEAVSAWIGTKNTFNVTAQYDPAQKGLGLGSIRADKTYIVHPEAIKQELRTGEAYCVSKVGRFGVDKLRIIY